MIQLFKEKHLDQTATLIASSFVSLNPIWQKNKAQLTDLVCSIRKKIIPCCNSTMSFILHQNQKIICASIQLDYVDYMLLPPIKSIQNSLLINLGKYAQRLDSQIKKRQLKQINRGQIKRGQIMYGIYGVINPEFKNKGLALNFWISQFSLGKLCGWRVFYSRLSNQASFNMIMALGGQQIARVNVQQTPGQCIHLCRLDLTNMVSPKLMLQKFIKNKKRDNGRL